MQGRGVDEALLGDFGEFRLDEWSVGVKCDKKKTKKKTKKKKNNTLFRSTADLS